MASVKAAPAKSAPAKTAPAKPGAKPAPAAPPKPAPKPAPAAPKPPPKAGATPAPKPPAAAPKPGAPAPKAPAAPKPVSATAAAPAKPAPVASGVTKADLDKLAKELGDRDEALLKAIEDLAKRVQAIEVIASGYGPYVTVDEATGAITLDIDNADEETLRNWAWQFNVGDHTADAESIRKAMTKARKAKDFAGWEAVNELPRPAGEEEASEGEAAEEGGEEEDEGEEITEEQIDQLNESDLHALGEQMGVETSDLKGKPKVLRNRLKEALRAMMEQGEGEEEAEGGEEAAGEEEGELPFAIDTEVLVTSGDDVYEGTFKGLDDDGDAIVEWTDGEQAAVSLEFVSAKE